MAIDTPPWVADAVFYQIFPDRFAASERVVKPGPLEDWSAPPTPLGFKGGDLRGIVERLDYLGELGVTALYLNPVFASASNHRYQTYDYLSVDPLLGGEPALRELLDACHGRGMRVLLDGVFNHAGRGFWAFHHVLEAGPASPYRDWFHFDQQALDAGRRVIAYPTPAEEARLRAAGRGAPHRTGRLALRHLGYRAWWDVPALPKFNVANPFAREYLLSVAEYWIRFGADGWRLDVPQEIEDAAFWRELRRRVRRSNPEAYLVGEIWHEAPDWLQGDRFDGLMNYPLAEAILGFAAGRHLDPAVVAEHSELAAAVRPLDAAGFAARLERLLALYPPPAVTAQLNLLGSHDTPRFLTLCGGDRASVRLAVLMQMTLPGAPCVYYGDEIGLEGHHDPDCRRAFPWDRSAWDHGLRDFVRGAIALRKSQPVLRRGRYRTVRADGEALVYLLRDDAGSVLVAINAGETPQQVQLEVAEVRGQLLVAERWSGWPGEPTWRPRVVADGRLEIEVPARDGLLLRTA